MFLLKLLTVFICVEGDAHLTKASLDLRGVMHSPNCKVALITEAATIHFDTYYRKATNYVLMVTIVSCCVLSPLPLPFLDGSFFSPSLLI